MIVRIQLLRKNDENRDTLIVENMHNFPGPEKQTWEMHPQEGSVPDGEFEYWGYTITLNGRERQKRG